MNEDGGTPWQAVQEAVLAWPVLAVTAATAWWLAPAGGEWPVALALAAALALRRRQKRPAARAASHSAS